MSSAFMIECPLRLNNEHNNRGRLCNEKYSYTGAEKKKKKTCSGWDSSTRILSQQVKRIFLWKMRVADWPVISPDGGTMTAANSNRSTLSIRGWMTWPTAWETAWETAEASASRATHKAVAESTDGATSETTEAEGDNGALVGWRWTTFFLTRTLLPASKVWAAAPASGATFKAAAELTNGAPSETTESEWEDYGVLGGWWRTGFRLTRTWSRAETNIWTIRIFDRSTPCNEYSSFRLYSNIRGVQFQPDLNLLQPDPPLYLKMQYWKIGQQRYWCSPVINHINFITLPYVKTHDIAPSSLLLLLLLIPHLPHPPPLESLLLSSLSFPLVVYQSNHTHHRSDFSETSRRSAPTQSDNTQHGNQWNDHQHREKDPQKAKKQHGQWWTWVTLQGSAWNQWRPTILATTARPGYRKKTLLDRKTKLFHFALPHR